MSVSRIVNNISAINANRNLDKTGRNLQKSIERLSSGLRINRAGDDAAGLSVANRLRTQVQGLNQAITNASDGISLINVAEGALEETTTRLNRIRVLAVQAANTAVNDVKARAAIQDEVFQSIDEVTRIANTTQFGSNFLLNGDFSIQTSTIAGQEYIGLKIDASPVASTLASGKSYLNIIQTGQGTAQIIAGDGVGGPQTLNAGIVNQTDVAVSLARFSKTSLTGGRTQDGDALAGVAGDRNFFNGVSIHNGDVFVFTGVLSDGVTGYNGTLSLSSTTTFTQLQQAIQFAIDSSEKALFGVTTTASVPSSFGTTVTIAAGGANAGRLTFFSDGNFINQTDFNLSLVRAGNIVTQASGVTRSGTIGIDSALSGAGQIGNAITAITGSTFGVGQFDIEVYNVQSAQQRKTESTIVFRDQNGAILDRTTTLTGTGTRSIVLNGSFVSGIYTGGTTLTNGDTITLTGVNADGTTFEGVFTYDRTPASPTTEDTTLNDFRFNSMSGLINELNYRTRDYNAGVTGVVDGRQTRFEDAIFTFTSKGVLQLVDDIGRSDSQMSFTLTFDGTKTAGGNFTFQDDAVLAQEGFYEQATFRIDGGGEVRANAGDVITLYGAKATIEGVPQPQVTLRVGTGFTAGVDKLENTPNEFIGSLNGGAYVTFINGDQNVVFIDGNSGGNRGVARFMTADFDNMIDVTARTDGLPDAGRTIVISTINRSLNFHVGAYAGQAFRAAIGDLTSENLGFGRGSGRTVADIDVTTIEGANEAMRIVDEALDQVNKTRSILGAATNRLESTISNLSVSAENLTASESRIRDTDIARESTEFTKNQVLIQAGVSVLAQANFQSQGFLSLLG
jgi:flagellin